MTDDTKKLLKSAASNSASVLGYLSTAATFFPIGEVARPYVRSLGLVLIIVGVFRGAQAVITEKNDESEAVTKENAKQAKDDEWAEKSTQAIQHLGNIIPRFFTGVPGPPPVGRSGGDGYHLVFPELPLRQRIEAHLIHLDSSHNKMQPRPLNVDSLRLRPVRQTIQEVLDRVEHVKATDAELATRLHL